MGTKLLARFQPPRAAANNSSRGALVARGALIAEPMDIHTACLRGRVDDVRRNLDSGAAVDAADGCRAAWNKRPR